MVSMLNLVFGKTDVAQGDPRSLSVQLMGRPWPGRSTPPPLRMRLTFETSDHCQWQLGSVVTYRRI